ncbi:MAG: MFS transporter, partial [Spirochaetaceae bacterium]|nr:MFS transporter [Spirochaetaceae bacterium]
TKKEKRKIFPDFRILFSSPIIFSLIIVSFTIQVANTTVNPIMPLFLRKIVAGTFYENFLGSATGIVLAAGDLSTDIASIISGKISPRIGYWKTLTCCLALGCVSLIPQAFTTKLWQLVVIHCFASFFIGGAVPLIQAMLATNCDRGHQGSLFGLNTSISSGGAALCPLIGSTAALISYRAVFPVTALILGISSIGIFRRQVRKTSVLK